MILLTTEPRKKNDIGEASSYYLENLIASFSSAAF